jgi:hypothetical protein
MAHSDSDSQPQLKMISWRKRHPVVSRVVLYALGLALGALLVHLFLERQRQDEQDRFAALAHELDALATLHVMDPNGTLVLEALDTRFSGADLPIRLQGRALRWRAMAHRKREELAKMEAALEKAAALDLAAEERFALQLEWAEGLLAFRKTEEARQVLPPATDSGAAEPLRLLRTLLHAQALRQEGKDGDALAVLQAAVAPLQAPLDPEVRVYVGGRDWTSAQVATVICEWLAGAPGQNPLEIWRRLHLLAPRSFRAQRACALGFLALDHKDEAEAAWALARVADPREAAASLSLHPALNELSAD